MAYRERGRALLIRKPTSSRTSGDIAYLLVDLDILSANKDASDFAVSITSGAVLNTDTPNVSAIGVINVPEPSSLALLSLGMLALARLKRASIF